MNLKSAPSSPAKGKAKETTQWRTGWWDYYSLTEYPKRPLEWSSSSVIFTAHPTQPLVTARHFSSSKQFVIPSPTPVISSPGVYEPPSIISVASGDDWLFAYFPRRDNEFEGTGCLWNRGTRIDGWNVKEWWDFPLGGGVVTAAWLGGAREWQSDATGSFIRLPSRGPRTPVSGPTVILVTQDHQIQLCYLRQYTSSLKMIKGSLSSPTFGLENLPLSLDTNQDEFGGIRQCIDATIGLFYNESSILIATHSRFIPPPSSDNQLASMKFDGDANASQAVDNALGCIWEACGEQAKVAACEVQLKFDGVNMGLATNPLPLLHRPSLSLTSLSFICVPSSVDNIQSPSMTKKGEQERSKIYLVTTYLDFNDFASIPKSELTLHSIIRQPLIQSQGISSKSAWVCHLEATRAFNSEVLVFAMPSIINFRDSVIYAGTVIPTGNLPTQGKMAQDIIIGSIKALKIPDLSDIENWESSSIKSTATKIGREMPLRVARSPNGLLACTLSSSTWPLQTAIHILPIPTRKSTTLRDAFAQSLSLSLISAVLGQRSTADITHLLALPSTPTSEVIDIFHHALAVLDKNDNGLVHSSIWDILGAVIDVYRSKAQRVRGEEEKKNLTARWQAAHDMCSLAACVMAFQDCQEGDGYDHDTVWQLNALSSWVISFTERLMKECVLSRDAPKRGSQSDEGSQVDPEPILLNLIHPYALQNFYLAVRHVKRYQIYLQSLSPSGEKAQIARDTLIDLVESSGINFVALEIFLEEILENSRKFEQNDCQRAFASCQLTPPMKVLLFQTLPKLTQSSILNKSMLFIKPSDLVDGIARLSMESHKSDKTQDVVTKGMLVKHRSGSSCLRCGGISEVENGLPLSQQPPIRWRVWERMWTFRCVCGGPWLSTAVQL